ncbi:unnamed protein product [Didymodactylos carnosus]|uniref:Uncharacterized protein n=1 Tax=Didymodactylos carnosus TaxID=1234261 RepID=A0A814VJE3_9BILA|nr:unnamed protein product [Didymodactylos carnosus]CAF1188876.1 unnamed protein product [Didymodactylos carnosus]CAF3673011.1 unnamed protein product [Didymodactylos carnosus]CAF3953165.1 unnamed protein product [Didymodactylos carnosus]
MELTNSLNIRDQQRPRKNGETAASQRRVATRSTGLNGSNNKRHYQHYRLELPKSNISSHPQLKGRGVPNSVLSGIVSSLASFTDYYPIPQRVPRRPSYEIAVAMSTSSTTPPLIEATKPASPRWWLVVPCLLIMMILTTADPLFMNDFIFTRYERYYHLDSSKTAERTSCLQQSKSTTTPIPRRYYQYYPKIDLPQQQGPLAPTYHLVQKAVSKLNVITSIASAVPAVITFIILGSNCDTIGRKPLLIIPFVGKVVRYTLLLIVVERNLADIWLIIAYTLDSTFGTSGLVMLASLAYITDCTMAKQRTRAFLLTEVAAAVVRIVPLLAVGLWLKYKGYTTPTSVNLTLSSFGLLYALVVQPESTQSVKHLSLLGKLRLIRFKKPLARIFKVFSVKRDPPSRRPTLICLTITSILLQLILFSSTSVHLVYLYGQPFCFNSLRASILSCAGTVSMVLVSAAILLFTRLTKIDLLQSFLFPIIGTCTYLIHLILFGVAKTTWVLYIG